MSAPTADLLVAGAAHKDKGNDAFRAGDWAAAIRHYKRGLLTVRPCVNRTPAMAMYSGSSMTDEEAGDYGTLAAALNLNLSISYAKLDDFERAKQFATASLEVEPSGKGMLRLAQAYVGLGDLGTAAEILAAALSATGIVIPAPVRAALKEEQKRVASLAKAPRAAPAASPTGGSGASTTSSSASSGSSGGGGGGGGSGGCAAAAEAAAPAAATGTPAASSSSAVAAAPTPPLAAEASTG